MLPAVTPETLAKAKAARQANVAARKASTLRSDFLDASTWDALARQLGFRQPAWGDPITQGKVSRYTHRLGKSRPWLEQQLGCSCEEFVRRNSDWPLRALIGIALEWLAQEQGMEV